MASEQGEQRTYMDDISSLLGHGNGCGEHEHSCNNCIEIQFLTHKTPQKEWGFVIVTMLCYYVRYAGIVQWQDVQTEFRSVRIPKFNT